MKKQNKTRRRQNGNEVFYSMKWRRIINSQQKDGGKRSNAETGFIKGSYTMAEKHREHRTLIKTLKSKDININTAQSDSNIQ